jgi:hypothetical protein
MTKEKQMKYLLLTALLLSAPILAADKPEVIIKRGDAYHLIVPNCEVSEKEKVRYAEVSRLKERAPIKLITDKNKLTCKVESVKKLT